MPHTPRVKAIAYQLDPECWISYSGCSPEWKRTQDTRRCAALKRAQKLNDRSPVLEINMPTATVTLDEVRNVVRTAVLAVGKNPIKKILDTYDAPTVACLHPHDYAGVIAACHSTLLDVLKAQWKSVPMPPLKLQMMLHFATRVSPFAPEETRRSEEYVTFVRELLRDELITRPTKAGRATSPGWAYKATPRGQCFVKALSNTPLPVRTDPVWAMPV